MSTRGAPSAWRDPVVLLALPAVAYLAIVYAYPLIWLLLKSFVGPSGSTIEPYIAFMSDPFNWRVIGNTLRVAVWTTVVCFLLGYPAAFALARSGALVQGILLVSIILPLSIGAVVKAFAWQIVLRRDGVVSQLMLGLGLWDEPQRLLFTETGLVLGAANIFLPFMILPIYAVVKLIDPRLREAGATLGADVVHLQVVADTHSGRAVVVSAIDNLVKGAAGQALQNANSALGLAEATGLTTIGVTR